MKDLTRGSILKNLVLFALPMLAGRLLNTAYNIVDTIYVGRIGHEAIGAVSLSFTIIFVILSLAGGLTMGTTVLVSQYFGAKNREMVNRVVTNSFVFIGLFAGVLALVGMALSPVLLRLLGAPESIYPLALGYMRIILAGIALMFGYFLIAAILRGIGDSKTPLKFMVVSTTLNIALDPLLIFGWGPFPQLGVRGAALATVFSQGIAAVLGFWYLLKREKYLQVSFAGFRVDWAVIKDIVRLGLPSGIAQMVTALGGTVVMSTIASFGDVAVATYGIGSRADSLVFMLIQTFGMAASTMVGQNIGAGKDDRVKSTVRSALALVTGINVVMSAVYMLLPSVIIRIFTNDPLVLAPTTQYIRIVSLGYVFFGIMMMLNSAVRGAGAMVPAMIISVVNLWVFRVPLAILLSRLLDSPAGVWWALTASFVLGSLVSALYYRFGSWRDKAVVRRQAIAEEIS